MITVALGILAAGAVQRSDFSGSVKLANGQQAALAAVWLEGTERARALSKAVVDQRDRAFEPHVSIVPVGTTMVFPNNDTVTHNVFAEYNANQFNLGTYPRGKSKTAVFNQKGLVVLLCNLHAEMSAFVLVVDTPYYSVADSKGMFKIKDVPIGKYKLRGWHESGQTTEQEIEIRNGAAVTLTLARKRR
jgi:plastocyanin